MIPIDRAVQNFSVPSGKDHFLYNSLYNRDVEFMKNLIRSSASEPERNPNPPIHCGEFDPRQVHDHQHAYNSQSSCFAPKSEHPSLLEHQQRLFTCGNGANMLTIATRPFACSQLAGLSDYSSETIKQQQQHQHHQCKSEKHDEDGQPLSGKCQMHSNIDGSGPGLLVKSEFNEMQQSKSSPVHEAFELTSTSFASTVTGSGSATTSQFHHDSGSPPHSLMEPTNSSSVSQHHLHHHPGQHQCSPHSYESYVYARSSGGGGRGGMSSRQPPSTMNNATTGSDITGGLYHCKSFFGDNCSGTGSSGITVFYPNSQQQQSNGESCRDDSTCFPSGRESLDNTDVEKVVTAIKARKMSD